MSLSSRPLSFEHPYNICLTARLMRALRGLNSCRVRKWGRVRLMYEAGYVTRRVGNLRERKFPVCASSNFHSHESRHGAGLRRDVRHMSRVTSFRNICVNVGLISAKQQQCLLRNWLAKLTACVHSVHPLLQGPVEQANIAVTLKTYMREILDSNLNEDSAAEPSRRLRSYWRIS
jgi:hypothetical protein